MRKGYVPVEPFKDWLERVIKYYPSEAELSRQIGMNWSKIDAILRDKIYKDHGIHMKVDKLSLETVDKAISKDGRYHLVEFYPEVYDER